MNQARSADKDLADDGHLVGSIAGFVSTDQTEVTYWVGRPSWERGVVSQTLELPLKLVPARPLHARAARDNIASLSVLRKRASTS